MLLAFAPAGALAHHHHRRHHSRTRHARIERFGRDVTTVSPTTNSADNAGTVQSFSGGRLTILLNDGSTVSGQVTGDTELECTAPEQNQTIHEDGDRSSDDPSGDDNGSGSGDDQTDSSTAQTSGDDQADAAEQNEDQNENEMNNNCSVSDVTQGTVVHEAELRLSSAGSVWKKVELGS
jgi:hypothetical protein